jgi:hypothetical protein
MSMYFLKENLRLCYLHILICNLYLDAMVLRKCNKLQGVIISHFEQKCSINICSVINIYIAMSNLIFQDNLQDYDCSEDHRVL